MRHSGGMNKEIGALTGLRGIAAIWVYMWHAHSSFGLSLGAAGWHAMNLLGAAGFLGVDVFFVLSGFVLAYNYGCDDLLGQPRKYGHFLWKRLARIYPVHLAALVLLAGLVLAFAAAGHRFLPASRLTVEGLVRSLTLTHAWAMPIAKTWNTVSWSISCEWAAYLCFPVIAAFSKRLHSTFVVLAVTACLFSLLAWVLHTGSHAGTMAYGLPRIAAEFTAGVLLYRMWQLRAFERSRWGDWLGLGALVTLILGANLMATNVSRYAAMLQMPILACAVVYSLVVAKGWMQRLLSARPALFLGRISYSFYLVHLLVMSSVNILLGPARALTTIVISLLATGFLATLLYRAVEDPARRWMLALSARPSKLAAI
jgi:peptidoglycan/LPS O-acetylase OafA/YrhL